MVWCLRWTFFTFLFPVWDELHMNIFTILFSVDLTLFVCYLCSHHSSFIFSIMNMVELLKKIEKRDVCVGIIGVGGGHQGFWLMGMVVSWFLWWCKILGQWLACKLATAKAVLVHSNGSTLIPLRFMSIIQHQLRRWSFGYGGGGLLLLVLSNKCPK